MMCVLVPLCPLEVCVQPEGVVRGPRHDAHPLVLAHSLLKEVGLSLQGDVLHEVEGVLHPVELQDTLPSGLRRNQEEELKI